MCGIVGIIAAYQNGLTSDEQNMFDSMLFLDTQRGWDSTGAFLVTNTGNMHLKKAAVHGADFIRTSEFKALSQKAWNTGSFFVGHNRAATRGTVSDENAHPFCVEDKIVLVQNGTYVGSHKHLKDTAVDTEAVAYVLAGEPDIEKALQQINAAYCLVWYDIPNRRLNMIRNDQRPMYLGENSDGGWMFASEIETLFYSAHRNKIKFKKAPSLIEPGDLHQWELDKKNKQWAYTVTKIDNKYRFKSGDTTGYDADMAAWEEYYGSGRARSRHPFNPVVVAGTGHIREVIKNQNARTGAEKTIFDYIQENKFPEFATFKETATAARDKWVANKPDSIIVEFIDYLEVYPNQKGDHCRWIIYGKRVTPDDLEYNPMIYIMVEGDETVALDFTINSMYSVTCPGGPILHKVSPPRIEDYFILSQFAANPLPVLQLEESQVVNH
jgi:hypothetical protein